MIERGNKDWRLMSRPRLDFIKETPRSSEFDDDYYSPEDGLAESTYVFIEGGDVINRMQALQAGETLTIGELAWEPHSIWRSSCRLGRSMALRGHIAMSSPLKNTHFQGHSCAQPALDGRR